MGIFSKEKKGDEVRTDLSSLPELPKTDNLNLPTQPTPPATPYPGMPGLPEIETNNLPTLPEIKQTQPSDQQEIKEALASPPNIPTSEFQKSEFDETKTNLERSPSPEYNEGPIKSPGIYSLNSKQEITEPVFIRLDKFQNAVTTFEEIIDKVNDIENLIKKTKEIRAKEEEELNAWEKEIHTIKARMDSIDKSVFSKLDLI